jgi:hypothetical protein
MSNTSSPRYDLVRLDANENVGGSWFGTANSLEEALEAIRNHALTQPGRYMVYSQETGSKAIYRATNDSVTPLNGAARIMSGG